MTHGCLELGRSYEKDVMNICKEEATFSAHSKVSRPPYT